MSATLSVLPLSRVHGFVYEYTLPRTLPHRFCRQPLSAADTGETVPDPGPGLGLGKVICDRGLGILGVQSGY